VAVDARALRLEVGYALEELIPDGFAGEVRDAIRPKFREGQSGEGLVSGTTQIINRIGEKRGVAIPDVPIERSQPSRGNSRSGGFPFGFLFWVVIFIIIVSRTSGRRRRRYWGGGPWSNWTGGVGPFGGGGFGGSGGGFGGGGGGVGRGGLGR